MAWLAHRQVVHLLPVSGFVCTQEGISWSRCQGRPWVQPALNVIQPPDC